MKQRKEVAVNTDLYERIKLAPMSAIQRQVALNALRDADAISNAVVWLVNAVRQLIAKAGAKPGNLKHSH